ncbi:MAG: hypothetical protein QOI41_6880 [Myxococcales bacterium]|nr:hypothetical protein [Myxococcales bacterium]
MDHRWDDMLQDEHRRRVEQSRYDHGPISRDRDVERRDQLEYARRRVNKSPWEIGAAHWDQRDLYTRNSRIDDGGYARGPSAHPDVGSYAYHRDDLPPPSSHRLDLDQHPNLYEREAWPWLHYEQVVPLPEGGDGLWGRVKHEAHVVMGKLTGHPHEHKGPKGWRRADDAIREDVCEALAYQGHLDVSDIEVEVKDAEVTLSGTVRDRASKRLAERLAELVRGVRDVHNRLTIRKDDDDMAFTAPIPAF